MQSFQVRSNKSTFQLDLGSNKIWILCQIEDRREPDKHNSQNGNGQIRVVENIQEVKHQEHHENWDYLWPN